MSKKNDDNTWFWEELDRIVEDDEYDIWFDRMSKDIFSQMVSSGSLKAME